MWRRAFALIAGLSLLLWILSAAFWVRGFFVGDVFWQRVSNAGAGQVVQRTVQVIDSRVTYNQYVEPILVQQSPGPGAMAGNPWKHQTIPSFALSSFHSTVPWRVFGFGHISAVRVSTTSTTRAPLTAARPVPNGWYGGARLLAAVGLSAVLPALWSFQSIRRRRLAAPGCCAHCGYDLRATPDGGAQLLEVCPECGTPRTAPTFIQ
jgi:hypothetical protein